MSRTILGIISGTLAGPIRSLRDRLGEIEGDRITQEEMARRIGSNLRAYASWELGENVPSGEWLIRILQLCPDEDSLAAFGIRNSESGIPPAGSVLADPYDELFKNLRQIIDSGQSQLIGQAEEVLSRLADDARYMTKKKRSKK